MALQRADMRTPAPVEPAFIGSVAKERQANILAGIARLLDAGLLTVHVSREWTLEQLPAAHRAIETGHIIGKLAVRVR